MREPRLVNEPVAHNCESQASVETERCVPPVGPEHSDVLLPEFSDDVVKELAPDAVAVLCRLQRHEAELHGGNVRRQRACTRKEACATRERARAPGPQMPRAGQVIVTDLGRGEVSITEYPRSEVVGVNGGDMLNLDDGHGAILTRFAPRWLPGDNPPVVQSEQQRVREAASRWPRGGRPLSARSGEAVDRGSDAHPAGQSECPDTRSSNEA